VDYVERQQLQVEGTDQSGTGYQRMAADAARSQSVSEHEQSKFDGWAIVEVFGHQRYAGYVTTEAFGQAVLFRVEVPPLAACERIAKHYEYAADGKSIPPGSTVQEDAVQGYSKLFGAGAIYGITPCTQEAAEKAIAAMATRKLTVVKLAPERAISASFVSDEGDETEDDFDNTADDDDEVQL
jgi:hypothetical protein